MFNVICYVMIKQCIVINRIIGPKSASFDLKLQNGEMWHITNCHLLNTLGECYMGTYEFQDRTGMWHYPIVRLNILRSKRTMKNVYDFMPKSGEIEIRYDYNVFQ